MAKHVEKVVGVEMVPEAVEDARFNATLNGRISLSVTSWRENEKRGLTAVFGVDLKNVEFIAGKVEDNIDVFRRENESIVAILDPPR